MPPELFWIQTPRINHSTIKGALGRIDREHRAQLVQARWSGAFAQFDPKAHHKVLKDLLKPDVPKRVMSGREIGGAMRALAARAAARQG